MLGEYVVVRTMAAGAHAGKLVSRQGNEVELANARRLWYWKGAFTLSDLAQLGVTFPLECRFPVAVDRIILTDVVEIISTTPEAQASIEGVPAWPR